MENTSKVTIPVYCTGGTGVNIGRYLWSSESAKGFADLELNFIDTSMSNFSPMDNIDPKRIMIIDRADGAEIDGSGQVRNEHAKDIVENVGPILHRFKPGKINFVISSASGGSGSVIGPSLVSEILNRGERVIVLLVGCKATAKFAANTLGTLMSYQNISNIRKEPVPVYYLENGKDGMESEVDENIIQTITVLRALYSGENLRMDQTDLRNWLAFQNVTSHEPAISLLSIVTGSKPADEDIEYCSVATLTATGKNATFPVGRLEYQITGFVSGDMDDLVVNTLPIHLALSTAGVRDIIRDLKAVVDEFEARKASRREQVIHIEGVQTQQLDNGLVL